MPTIDQFNELEKIFLAGCIKSIILADGKIENEELADLDHLISDFNFTDYDRYLNLAEEKITDDEAFWEMAAGITRLDVQGEILAILYELSVQEGFQNQNAHSLIEKLKSRWAC